MSFPDRTLCKFVSYSHLAQFHSPPPPVRPEDGEALFVIRRIVHQVCVHLFQQIDVFIFIGTLYLDPVSRSLVIVLPDHSRLRCSSPFVIVS